VARAEEERLLAAEEARPELQPGVVADRVADHRRDEQTEEQERHVQLLRAPHQPRDHQQRIARQEEAEGEARLGEDDEHQPRIRQQQPLRRQKIDDVLRVKKLFDLM
jgi:hypothetical protein